MENFIIEMCDGTLWSFQVRTGNLSTFSELSHKASVQYVASNAQDDFEERYPSSETQVTEVYRAF